MKKTIMATLGAVVLALIISVGVSEMYYRNETFRKGYIGYANAVIDCIDSVREAVGIHAPKIIVVE